MEPEGPEQNQIQKTQAEEICEARSRIHLLHLKIVEDVMKKLSGAISVEEAYNWSNALAKYMNAIPRDTLTGIPRLF